MEQQKLEPMAVSVTEAARLLGVSRPKAYDLVNRTDFPSFRLGGRTLVSVAGLREWIAVQAAKGGDIHDL